MTTWAGKPRQIFKALGKACVVTGRVIGQEASRLYNNIDPDLPRHLLQTPLLSYSLFSSRKQIVAPLEPDGHPPLIFVHGLGGSRGDFLLMSSYFWLKGRSRHYRIHFKKGLSMQQMAKALAMFIRKVKEVNSEKKVDIVAHSLGGVVSRIALSDHRLSNSVRTMVTLGSPHQGTHAARLLSSTTLRDLRPDSALITSLRRKKWPKKTRGITLWSRNDLMIVPHESAKLPGTTSIEMTPFTHYSYLIDPKCWKVVHEALALPH